MCCFVENGSSLQVLLPLTNEIDKAVGMSESIEFLVAAGDSIHYGSHRLKEMKLPPYLVESSSDLQLVLLQLHLQIFTWWMSHHHIWMSDRD